MVTIEPVDTGGACPCAAPPIKNAPTSNPPPVRTTRRKYALFSINMKPSTNNLIQNLHKRLRRLLVSSSRHFQSAAFSYPPQPAHILPQIESLPRRSGVQRTGANV